MPDVSNLGSGRSEESGTESSGLLYSNGWCAMRKLKARLARAIREDRLTVPILILAVVLVLIVQVALLGQISVSPGAPIPNLQPFADPTGTLATYNTSGDIDTTNPFFQSLGTNGRACVTCHQPSDGFSFSAAHAKVRFDLTGGTDPLFAAVDGANCPNAKTGSEDQHSLILNDGLIRIGLQVPPNPQFSIRAVHDPYGCALVTDPNTGQLTASVYRRPLPTTNLDFLSAVMFDGRETIAPLNNPSTFSANLTTDLTHQAMDATNGHAQASPPLTISDPRLPPIVNLELGFFTAQTTDQSAGQLNVLGANGGPQYIAGQPYYPGINDSLTPSVFNPMAFTIYSAWQNLSGSSTDPTVAARQAVAAGELLFDTFPLTITAVRGLNDNPALGSPAQIIGTCTTCHDTPNVGNHSLPLPLDIGTSHSAKQETNAQIAGGLSQLSVANLPVFELSGCPDPQNPGGVLPPFYTSDPGKALISGACADINRIKGPILRGLAARAPYFHNGAAANLNQVVDFYNQRFQMNLTDQQKAQLVAFLQTL
jgi:cytochrome c peroxidase